MVVNLGVVAMYERTCMFLFCSVCGEIRNLNFYVIRRLIERVHDLYVHVACIVYHLA